MPGELRKVAVKRLIKDQNGQAMILAVILLLVGGIIVSSLLAYMGNGLLNGRVYERRTAELYAADAGVEAAVLIIQSGNVAACPASRTQTLPDINVNGKSVGVTITWMNNTTSSVTYRVDSTATGSGSGTNVTAYVTGVSKYGDYAGLLNQIVTTQGTIDEKSKVYLNYTPENAPVEGYTGAWPTESELKDFYWQDVKNVTPYSSDTIDINGVNTTKGPLYRSGTLDIHNSDNNRATLKLTGTLYITGKTIIGTTQKEFTLDLNGNTIFVSSNLTGSQAALSIGGQVDIKGPGCIIAVGDIYFQPNSQIGTNPVFVLSVLGTTLVQPNGSIYGAIAGSVEVQLKSGTTLTYPTGGFESYDLNFLSGIQALVYSIASWQAKPS
jgi:hypothetical protein